MIQYFWQIIYAHTIAYFVAGVFALLVMNYRDLFATDVISSFMKPVDEPIVVLGPVLQIFRGILLALVLLPLRKVFFMEKMDNRQTAKHKRRHSSQTLFMEILLVPFLIHQSSRLACTGCSLFRLTI